MKKIIVDKGVQVKLLSILSLMKNKPYIDLSILVVEDEANTRVELVELLELDFGFVYSAQDGCEGLEFIEKFHPDIIVTDISMPCMDGLDMMKEAKKSANGSIFIFTTAFNDSKYVLDALDNHAYAYLVKPVQFDALLKKINELVTSYKLLNNDSSEVLHKILSSREYEVFLDIAKGIKPNSIALKYDVKPKTISTYRKRILEKMRFNSNAEIIHYAITNNLLLT